MGTLWDTHLKSETDVTVSPFAVSPGFVLSPSWGKPSRLANGTQLASISCNHEKKKASYTVHTLRNVQPQQPLPHVGQQGMLQAS
jgi:hypothetical protein